MKEWMYFKICCASVSYSSAYFLSLSFVGPPAKRAAWYIISSCLSVCLSDHNFRKPWRRKFVFALYLRGIRVKVIQSRVWLACFSVVIEIVGEKVVAAQLHVGKFGPAGVSTLGDQLRWAYCFSGSPPLCFIVMILLFIVFLNYILHSWPINWLGLLT